MTKERDTVLDGLQRLAWNDGVPAATQDRAKALLQRLDQSVRVAILGLPQSGKSTLVNVFLGEELLPRDLMLPPVEFRYGDTELLRVTEAQGEITVIEGLDFTALSDDCLYIQAEAPAPVLKEISLLEVAAEGTGEEQENALRWAARRADITVWCSQEYARVERLLWASAPEKMKDHGFLAITKADLFGDAEDVSSRMAVFKAVAEAEFLDIFPSASEAALAARTSGDAKAWEASSANAMLRAVLGHAESGRRADLDAAHVFVLRHEDLVSSLPEATRPEFSAEPRAATSKPITPTPEPEVVAAPEPEAEPETDAALLEACAEGAQYLRARAGEISGAVVDLNEDDAAEHVLSECMETVEQLQELMDASSADQPEWETLKDEVSAANDMIVLMQLERGTEPAADAVTLLLQLRRSLDAKAA